MTAPRSVWPNQARRQLLSIGAAAAGLRFLACGGCATPAGAKSANQKHEHDDHKEAEVAPGEDLIAGREIALVTILLRQHERGRQLTDEIMRRASGIADLAGFTPS